MVKYSPTGKHIYSAGNDKAIKMWDVASGIDVNTFNAHQGAVLTIELSKDGQTLISGDSEGKIIVWNAITGEVLQEISAHEGAVNTAKLSKDGNMIVSGGDDELLRMWSLQGDSVGAVTGFNSPIKNLAISPDGTRIVTGGGKNNGVEVKLIDVEKQKILADALDNVKGSGAALAYTKAIMTGFAVVGNIANGRIGKDMATIFVMSYSNIEFTKDGSKILLSQNLYVPFIASKGEEEENGSASVSIVALSEDRNSFGEVSKPIRWNIANPRGVAVFNEDQTKVIVNEKFSIKVYDIENADFPEPGNKEAIQYVPPVAKKIKNIPFNTNWLALSPDYRTIVTADIKRELKLWDYNSSRKIRDLKGYVQPALAVDVMPDGKHILVGTKGRNMTMWDITTGQLAKVFDRSPDINHIDVSSDGSYMATTVLNTKFVKVWNFKTARLLRSLMNKKDNLVWAKFNPEDEDEIWTMEDDGDLVMWSVKDIKSKGMKGDKGELEDKFEQNGYSIHFEGYQLSVKKSGQEIISDRQNGIITDAVFSVDSRYAITTNENGEIAMYDLQKKSKTASMALINENDFIAYTPDYFYTSSKGAAQAIAFKADNNVLPFEQLELRYNRPDVIAERMGYAPDKLVKSYKAAYEKRIQRLGFTPEELKGNINLPTVSIDTDKLPLETDQRELTFVVEAKDKSQSIKRIQVFDNGVPIFGSKGIPVSGQQVTKEVTVSLTSGLNEIRVTAINATGQESLASSFEVQHTAEYDKPDLYMVSIGVSEYQQPAYNLAFAAKDANDILATLKGSSAYEQVYSKVLTNTQATDSGIKSIRSFIEQAKVDDVVIIFIAGHGVLDNNYTYYFATHNMDFSDPSNGGLSYEDLEKLIDGIPCRNKLLMMDTCHSGELDKDEVETANKQVKSTGSVAFRSTGDLIKLKESSFGLKNTLELSKTLFGDMRKGTGANVISAAGGTEFAAEGVNSANGLFTSCFIQGLTTRRADRNRDRSYTISEIRDFVSEQVIRISGGNQVPTSREENIKNDFRVY
ncbi:MAG: hypothetical protein Tsb0034_13790 [Ekhidna sp.]